MPSSANGRSSHVPGSSNGDLLGLGCGDDAKTGEKLDVSYVLPEAVFSAVIFPKRILTSAPL
jgi:hypothetical protein